LRYISIYHYTDRKLDFWWVRNFCMLLRIFFQLCFFLKYRHKMNLTDHLYCDKMLQKGMCKIRLILIHLFWRVLILLFMTRLRKVRNYGKGFQRRRQRRSPNWWKRVCMPFVCVCTKVEIMESGYLQSGIFSLKMFVHVSLEIQVSCWAFCFICLQTLPSYFSYRWILPSTDGHILIWYLNK
jgi:hypothetical protein